MENVLAQTLAIAIRVGLVTIVLNHIVTTNVMETVNVLLRMCVFVSLGGRVWLAHTVFVKLIVQVMVYACHSTPLSHLLNTLERTLGNQHVELLVSSEPLIHMPFKCLLRRPVLSLRSFKTESIQTHPQLKSVVMV